MPYQDIGGLRLFYREAGSGTQTIVLVHGNVASSRWWERVLPDLSQDYRVIAPDLRGFGQSDKPGGYTVEQFAADLAVLVDALSLPPAHIVGHSLGGSVVLQYVLDHPHRCRSLVLVDPGPAEGQVTPEERYPLLEAIAVNREYMKAAVMGVTPAAPRDDYFEALVDDAMLAGGALLPIARDLNTWNVQSRLGQIKVPTLVLQGEQDSLVSQEAVRRTVAGIAGARLEVVPGVGHSPQAENPEDFVRRLRMFLR